MAVQKPHYLAPSSDAELLDTIASLRGKARVLAGGTDLIPLLRKHRLDQGLTLVSLKNLPWRYIRETEQDLHIGATATHREVAASELVKVWAPLLATGSGKVGSIQIRNVATIGGNIANAGPSADTAAPLLALGARLTVASKGRTRVVPLESFYRGPSRNCLEPDEVITEIALPKLPPQTGSHYEKFSPRSAMDLAWAGVAVIVTLDESGKNCADVRIGLAAVAPMPMRAVAAEQVMRGQAISEGLIDRMAQVAAEECQPNPKSRRVPAWYRREIVRVLVRRGFVKAYQIATAAR